MTVESQDNIILDHLNTLLADHRGSVDTIQAWWKAEKSPGESIIQFLIRQKILVSGAARTIDLISKGYVEVSCRSALVTPGGLAELQRRTQPTSDSILPEMKSSTPEESSSPAPETLGVPVSFMATEQASYPMYDPPPPVENEHSPTTTRRVRDTGPLPHRPAPPRQRSWPPTPGTTLGKYLLTEMIGQGTSGVVFRALNMTLNLPVALKALRVPEEVPLQRMLEALTEEARVLAHLNHPNVIRLWDFEADPEAPFLVMEYVEGWNLADLIKQSGLLSPQRVVELGTQVILGLAAAWKVGVVHRDVKPHNILVTKEGTPKIVDLGLAIVVDQSSLLFNPRHQTEMAGTAAYMAPEQGKQSREAVDHRADIYSLGVTLYHALTGRLPYQGQTAREMMVQHAQGNPVPPHELTAGVPEALSEVVLTMMSRDPDDRFHSAEEIVEALQATVSTKTAPPITSPSTSTSSAESKPSSRRSGFWKRLITGN